MIHPFSETPFLWPTFIHCTNTIKMSRCHSLFKGCFGDFSRFLSYNLVPNMFGFWALWLFLWLLILWFWLFLLFLWLTFFCCFVGDSLLLFFGSEILLSGANRKREGGETRTKGTQYEQYQWHVQVVTSEEKKKETKGGGEGGETPSPTR